MFKPCRAIPAEKHSSRTCDLRTKKLWLAAFVVAALLLATQAPRAQETAVIRVDASAPGNPFGSSWAFFGYDEPNFTYAEHGKKLLQDLSSLSPAPVYIRAHNLLASGDGKPALKWGSTNAYREDVNGRPVYDWTILDRIFDTYMEAGVKPLVEIGFMPEALSVKPQPYQHSWPEGTLWTGWAYPPKDYRKWAGLVFRWVRHAVDRYGEEEVASWYWEVWNEPDIGYWQGTPEEYYKLYDFATDAVKRALPEARVGGPHSTGPGAPRAAEFLRRFLEHSARGTNFATGKKGSPLDFIAFHAKGRPQVVDGHVRMGINRQLESIDKGFEIVASFPEYRSLPVIIGESDPEGCAACSARVYPQNAYRNGALYPCYTAAVLGRVLELAERHQVHVEGVLTWAFEFEDQPYFDGFRTLATNGIAKPALNVFRMFGLMSGRKIPVVSTQATPLEVILESGVTGSPDISALATREDRRLSVLAWNYHDDDVPSADAPVELIIEGLPASASRVLVLQYRIDEQHSNAYTVWKELGSPQSPTPEQYSRLVTAGQLELCASPQWISPEEGSAKLRFRLPRYGTSLVQLSW